MYCARSYIRIKELWVLCCDDTVSCCSLTLLQQNILRCAARTAHHNNIAYANQFVCLLQAGANPNAEDGGGRKAIHAAAAEQHREIVELLLPKTSPDSDNALNWTVDGIINEAQQSIADDQPQSQEPQVICSWTLPWYQCSQWSPRSAQLDDKDNAR